MNKTNRFVSIVLWAIIAISAVLVTSFIVNISDDKNNSQMLSWLSNSLIWAYVLLIGSVVILALFAIYQMVTDFSAAKKGLISIGFLAAVVLIAYLASSAEMPKFFGVDKFIENGTLTPTVVRNIDMGLIATYIMLGLSVVAILYSSISRLLDR
jgi:hypothetical protein